MFFDREIRKELKIKEGAEKLRGVSTDRKSLSHVATIVKNSNFKLTELKNELSELESQIILSQGQSAPATNTLPPSNGGKCTFCIDYYSVLFLMHVTSRNWIIISKSSRDRREKPQKFTGGKIWPAGRPVIEPDPILPVPDGSLKLPAAPLFINTCRLFLPYQGKSLNGPSGY